jgi:hypothetical protein
VKKENQNEPEFNPDLFRKLIEQLFKLDEKLQFGFDEDDIVYKSKLTPSGFMIYSIKKVLRDKDKMENFDFDSIFTEEEKKKIEKIISFYENKEEK